MFCDKNKIDETSGLSFIVICDNKIILFHEQKLVAKTKEKKILRSIGGFRDLKIIDKSMGCVITIVNDPKLQYTVRPRPKRFQLVYNVMQNAY